MIDDGLELIKFLQKQLNLAEEEFARGWYYSGEEYLEQVKKGIQSLKERI